ncbi:hypothetical protein FEDK69T_31710 [Flavobacterium enshiense DK69]|nr:hypothetical protein FEDK69T_31710 [Flavobacterium enshiense DK69]
MKKMLFLTFVLFCIQNCFGQELRLIHGKVLEEGLEPMPGVQIMINDSVRIGQTDLNGNFELQLNPNIKKIEFDCIGCERTPVILKSNCSNLEVIILLSGTHCFAKPKKVERIRKKRFQTLQSLYKSAYEKGLFKSSDPCGDIQFVSWLSNDKKPSP